MFRPWFMNWIRRNILLISSVTAGFRYPLLATKSKTPAPFPRKGIDRSVGNFVVAILLHPEETQNKLICVQGQLSSWDEIVAILEKLQGTKYKVTYTSIADAEAMEEQAWAEGSPNAFRLNLRRCMGTGNAKLEHVDNAMFPEVQVTTDLEAIAKKALQKKGLLK
jgi:hypothetical protein